MTNHCIILAAGKNTRLDTGKPKSLIEIKGMTLLERHIRNFQSSGINHFCIVTGHNPEPIRDIAPVLASSYNVQIDLVHNDRFDLENGYSVNAARNWVMDNETNKFLLTMGDHLFQREFVKEFIMNSQDTNSTLKLACDVPGEMNEHIDIDDVTKVLADDNGLIKQIGKNIAEYNYYDTGLFCLKSEVFEVLQQCFKDGRYSISDMVSRLILDDQAKVVELTGYLWNDVDNPDDLNNTLRLGLA